MSAQRTIIAMALCGLALAITGCDDELVPAAPVEDTGAPIDDVAETSSEVALEPDAEGEVEGDSAMHADGHMTDGEMDVHDGGMSDGMGDGKPDGTTDAAEGGDAADAHVHDAADAAEGSVDADVEG